MEEKMMGNDMDKAALKDEKMMIEKAMGLAKQMDDMEEEEETNIGKKRKADTCVTELALAQTPKPKHQMSNNDDNR